jgi:uncharacterized membrane protein YphA (DoxX/SURF4 family)
VRWFSAFPGRGAGVGLLLLRLAVGLALTLHGASRIAETALHPTGGTLAALCAIVAGVALLSGLYTAAAALVAVLISAIESASVLVDLPGASTDQAPVFVVVLLVSLAIALLGPGAFSIDSYRFGRREIVIPGDSPSRRH